MALFLRSLTGKNGKITIPTLGAVVATFSSWTIARPEESDPGNPGALTLRAVCSYVNPVLFNDPELPKKVIVTYDRTTNFEIKGRMSLFDDNVLLVEEAELCPE
jgi:hypothetical protein